MCFLFSGVPALSEEEHITGFDRVGFLFNLNTETKHADIVCGYSGSFPLVCSDLLVK